MDSRIKLKTLIILLWIGVAASQKNCCREGVENHIRKGRCPDGSKIVGVSCKSKFKLEAEDNQNFTINDNMELVMGEDMSSSEYCLATEGKNETQIAIVCFTDPNNTSFYLFRAICEMISVLFLILTLIVYILVPQMRDLQGKCLMCLITTLAVSMLSLGIMQFGVYISNPGCAIVGYLTYAMFISTFAWLNVISFHIFRTTLDLISLGTNKQWEIIYAAYGFGLPIIFIIISITAHHASGDHVKPGIGEGICWFSGRTSTWSYFYGPIAVMLFMNLIFFIFTIKKLWSDTKEITHPSKIKVLRYKCLLYVKLFFVMGLSWSFEIISFAFDQQNNFIDYIWMVTDFINAIQGVLIFLILVVFRKRARKGLANNGLFGLKLPSGWKSLHDEECYEANEEEQIPKEYIYEKNLNNVKENSNIKCDNVTM